MSNGEAPQTRDINLLGPSQNPQNPTPLLAPQNQEPDFWESAKGRIAARSKESQDRDLMRVFRQSLAVDPELAAEAKQKGLELGLNPRVAETTIAKVRELWQAKQYRAMLNSGGSKVLFEQMLDPEFARIAHDDLPNLSVLENILQQWDAGTTGHELSMLRFKQSQNFGILSKDDHSKLDLLQARMDEFPQDSSGHGPLSLVYGGSRMLGGTAGIMAKSAAAAVTAGATTAAVSTLFPVTLPFTTTFAAAVAGAGTLGVLSGKAITGQTYGEMIRLGISHDLAKGHAEWAGIAGGLLEAGSMGFIGGKVVAPAVKHYFKSLALKEGAKQTTRGAAFKAFGMGVGKTIVSEEFTELSQEAISWALASRAIGKTEDKSTLNLEDRGNLKDNLVDTFWETLRGVAIMSTFAPAIQLRAQTRKAKKAILLEGSFEKLADNVQEAKLPARDMDKYVEYLDQTVDKSGGPPVVFFDLETFAAQMTEGGFSMEDLRKHAPDVADAMLKAQAEGHSDIEISTATFGAKFLTEDFGRALIPHARTEPGGYTAAEALDILDAKEDLTAKAQELLGDEERANAEFRAGVTESRTQMKAQLLAAGATETEASVHSTLHSNFVAVRAEQLGLTPAEFEEQHGLKITKDEGQEGDALEQPGTPAFDAWFGESKVVDEEGKPLVVYHGTDQDVTQFDPDRGMTGPISANPIAKYGFFFSEDPGVTETYSSGVGGRTIPVYLSMQNPAQMDMWTDFAELSDEHGVVQDDKVRPFIEALKAKGHDGIVLHGGDPATSTYRELMVFDPTQIKSPQNRGTYSPDSANILEQRGSAFDAWFVGSKVVDEEGKPLQVYHGSSRVDRVGDEFQADRATSGPMPFFTDSPELASSYSTNKSDTSLESPASYAEWFRYDGVDLDRAWSKMSREERSAIRKNYARATDQNTETALEEPAHLLPEGETSVASADHWAQVLRESGGNPLKAMVSVWLEGGTLFGDEGRFIGILRAAGMNTDRLEYEPPHKQVSGVVPVYLDIKNPLDTSEIPADLIEELREASQGQEAPDPMAAADQWDKRSVDGETWMQRLDDDAKSGSTHAWTSVPDWVTAVLRARGYDGIKDTGGKGGGAAHGVWVPFDPGQIKSPQNRGNFDATNPNILEQGEQRGRYLPGAQQAILTENADPSTVLHEMVHHFVNVSLQIASKGEAKPLDVRPGVSRTNPILDDVDAMMTFWKIEGATAEERLATWNSMSFEEQAPHQESLAYNWELWLFEGKAPTTGLRRLFEKIRAFMVNVYKTVIREEAEARLAGTYQANFGQALPGMTEELRDLFRRMVAGEQAATQIVAERELAPMFTTQEEFVEAGNQPGRWEEYLRKSQDWLQQLVSDLTGRSLRAQKWSTNARKRAKSTLTAEENRQRRAVREEVAAQVAEEPLYAILSILKEQKNGLDREAVYAILGAHTKEAKEAIRKRLAWRIRKTGGYNPDEAASLAPETFPTGESLVRAMIESPSFDEAVEARTAEEMAERSEPLSIEDQVEQAVHSEARSRFAAAELKFLEGATKPSRVILGAAKAMAQSILARRALNDMSVHKFGQLESRANAAAHRAMQDQDLERAAEAKQRALLYNQLAKLALEAKEEIGKAEQLFARVSKDSNKKLSGKRKVELVHAARAILAQVGLVSPSVGGRTADYMKLLMAHAPDLYARNLETLAYVQDQAKEVDGDFRNMSLDQFRALRELVDSLWYRSKREMEIKTEGDKKALDEVAAELIPVFQAKTKDKGERRGSLGDHPIRDFALSTIATLRKVEHWAYWMDDGKIGPVTRHLFLNVRDALTEYRTAKLLYSTKFVDIVKEAKENDLLPAGKIEAPELDDHFDGMMELLGAIAHQGNESNKSKFLVAGRWTSWADVIRDGKGKVIDIKYDRWDAMIQRLVDDERLTKGHFDLIQSMWNLLEEIKPLLQKAHYELEGHYFKEVQAQPFEIHFPGDEKPTTYAGGYIPASADYAMMRELNMVEDVETGVELAAKEFKESVPSQVAAGFVIERKEGARERPLTMDLGKILTHIDATLRYAYVGPPVKDMGRLLNHTEFQDALNRFDPQSQKVLAAFMERAVTQSLYKRPVTLIEKATDRAAKALRRLGGLTVMAWNSNVALQQSTGINSANVYVKTRHLMSGIAQVMRNPFALSEEIAKASEMMKNERLENQMFKLEEDYRMISNELSSSDQWQARGMRLGYVFTATAQNLVDMASWKGAYEQALENADGNETVPEMEKRAVEEADQVVRLSQSSFAAEDHAAYEQGQAWWRLGTQFSNYFNNQGNVVRYAPEGRKLRAAVSGFYLPMVLAQGIGMLLYDRWKDEDDDGEFDADVWGELFLTAPAHGALAMLPGIGPQISRIYESQLGDRPFGDRVVSAPGQSTLVKAFEGLVGAMVDLKEGGGVSTRNAKQVFSLAVMLVPGAAVIAPFIRSGSYATGVARDETEPTSAWDAIRGLATGYASEDSKR